MVLSNQKFATVTCCDLTQRRARDMHLAVYGSGKFMHQTWPPFESS